jgi:polyisoprenoid-binding protein YceI
VKKALRVLVYAVILAVGLVGLRNWSVSVAHAQAPATGGPLQTTGTWNVDPAHTSVNFAIRHFGISLVHGRFDKFAGTIVANAEHPEKSSVQFAIQADSIDTNVKMRDDDLRGANYFDVAKFPQITFQSTGIKTVKKGDYVAVGNLTMHGVTKEISLPFHPMGPIKDRSGGSRAGLVTELRLSRLDYGVGGSMPMDNGEMPIGKDVDISISLEAVSAKPATTG